MTRLTIKDFALFADVSICPGPRLGVGAYIALPASSLETSCAVRRKPEIAEQITIRRLECISSSTKLELQTLLWAIREIRPKLQGGLTIYSDSQCIAGLLKRKARLIAGKFLSKKTGQELSNAPLYRAFYKLHDDLGFQVVKVKGHSAPQGRDAAHRIFSCVDKKARKALKIWLKESAEVKTEPMSNPWCVYVLRCGNNALYIGMTNTIGERLEKHKLGTGSKFVRSWRPFELVKMIPCRDAGEARRLEYNLKRLTRKKKIEVLDLQMGNRGYCNHGEERENLSGQG